MKIGELARHLGSTVSALRFYEHKGLVKPGRSDRGTRQYSEEDEARFQALLNLASFNVPLDRIHSLTEIRAANMTGDAASRQADAELAQLEQELTSLHARLEATLSDIEQARTRLGGCNGCEQAPRKPVCQGCPVAGELLECRVMHIVWDQ